MPPEPSRNRGTAEAVAHAGVIGAEEFSDLFREAFRVLWVTAAGIVGNRSLADDILQEAALVAFEKREQFERGSSFLAWMGQIVRFVALNYGRRERRAADAVGESGVLENADAQRNRVTATAEPGRDASSSMRLTTGMQLPPDQVHLDDRIVQALNEINETARACLLLRVVEGLDYTEIARVLDVPKGTAMSHVHRSRQILRKRLASSFGRDGDDTEETG